MIIELNETEFNIRNTLCGGQTFTWRESVPGVFVGHIAGHLVEVTRVDPSKFSVRFKDERGEHGG